MPLLAKRLSVDVAHFSVAYIPPTEHKRDGTVVSALNVPFRLSKGGTRWSCEFGSV